MAITPGDPRGIGPEVALSAVRELLSSGIDFEPVFVGSPDAGPGGFMRAPPDSVRDWVGDDDLDDAAAGRVAGEAIERAVALALDGGVHAIVTAPIHKPSLHAAGWSFPGHTEMLRNLSRAACVGMLMSAERTHLGGPLRVLLATTHVATRDVAHLLTEELLVEQTSLLASALRRDWALPDPRIALCAFNPHASDGGLFGDEEARIYRPALETLRTAGVEATGPLPADTVFQRTLRGDFDAVVAPYHDVGMAAFKTIAFGSGVNVTLGLPFVRTSPDHGTAFDLAGSGRADPSSMREAIRLAVRLAARRFDTSSPMPDPSSGNPTRTPSPSAVR